MSSRDEAAMLIAYFNYLKRTLSECGHIYSFLILI